MGKIVAIARNALTETVRQPVFVIILAVGAFMISLSPSFTMFTMMDDVKLLKDMGLATILLAGLLQAAFSAGNVISDEVERKTILSVLSKPVSKAQLILGKFVGIAVALAGSTYLLTLILILTIRIGVPEAVYIKLHRPVIFGEIFAFAVGILLASLANYFRDRQFCSSCFGYCILSFTFVFILLGFIDKDLNFQRFCSDVDIQVVVATYLVLVALLSIAAVAVAISTRFSVVLTVGFCTSIFLLGLLSDHMFGRFDNIFAKAAYVLIPNMQVFWMADMVVAGQTIPARYVLQASGYGFFYSLAILLISIVIFEAREIT